MISWLISWRRRRATSAELGETARRLANRLGLALAILLVASGNVHAAGLDGGSAADGLRLQFCFDEARARSAADSSGQGHGGTFTNSPTWVAGKYFYALRFDGTRAGQAYVSFGPNDTFDDLTQGTIMAWVKQASGVAPEAWLSWFFAGRDAVGLYLAIHGNRFWSWAGSSDGDELFGAYVTLPTPVTDWHHLAYVVSATGNQLYVDGTPRATGHNTTGSDASTVFFQQLSSGTSRYRVGSDLRAVDTFDGIIDDVRVYDVPLAQAQIQAAMGAPGCPRVSPACPGDCDGANGVLAADVGKIVGILSKCGPCSTGSGSPAIGCTAVAGTDKQCTNADYDRDGCITAGELTRVVLDLDNFPAAHGCPP